MHIFLHSRLFVLSRLVMLTIFIALVSCGGSGGSDDSDGGGVTPPAPPRLAAPVFTSIVAGDGEISMAWTHVDEPADDPNDGSSPILYNLYYTTDPSIGVADLQDLDTTVASITALSGTQVVSGLDPTEITITGLTNLSLYFFVLTAVDSVGEGAVSFEGFALPRSETAPIAQALNDTGVARCGDYAFGLDIDGDGSITQDEVDLDNDDVNFEHDNDIDCLAGDTDNDDDPIPAQAQQDVSVGLDVVSDNADGLLGFSFTKLDASGTSLAASATEWSCVQDNVTGVVWQAHTAGLYSAEDRFSWYDEDGTINGGNSGVQMPSSSSANNNLGDDICFGYTEGDETTYCNTQAFIARVNADVLCGFSDWRLPDRYELRSIVNYGFENTNEVDLIASVDLDYFPNTQVDGGVSGTAIDGGVRYWSFQTSSANNVAAWSMFYGRGGAPLLNKGTPNAVRLVRTGP